MGKRVIEELVDVAPVTALPEKEKELKKVLFNQKMKWILSDFVVVLVIFIVSLLFFYSFFDSFSPLKALSVASIYFIAFEELRLHKMFTGDVK